MRESQRLRLIKMDEDAKRLGRPSPVPLPIFIQECKKVGDKAWTEWFETRPEGIVLAESARSSGNSSDAILSNLARARIVKEEKLNQQRATEEDPEGNGWTRCNEEPIQILKRLAVPFSSREVVRGKSTRNAIIQCNKCGIQGLTE